MRELSVPFRFTTTVIVFFITLMAKLSTVSAEQISSSSSESEDARSTGCNKRWYNR